MVFLYPFFWPLSRGGRVKGLSGLTTKKIDFFCGFPYWIYQNIDLHYSAFKSFFIQVIIHELIGTSPKTDNSEFYADYTDFKVWGMFDLTGLLLARLNDVINTRPDIEVCILIFQLQ